MRKAACEKCGIRYEKNIPLTKMLTAAIEPAREQLSFEDSGSFSGSDIYGLIPKPEDGLEEIKLLWNRRTSSSYQKISLPLNIAHTLWRNAKSGSISSWMPQMISDIGKKDGSVVENYINMNILPIVTQQRLALENMGLCRTQIFKSYHLAQKIQDGRSIQKPKLTACFEDLIAEINHYPGLLDLEENLGDILAIVPQIIALVGEGIAFDDFINTFEQARFEKLDELIRSSEWADNCLQIQEIYQKRLFRFRYGSFDEYCKTSKLTQGMRRVKIGEVIRQIQAADLPLPSNRGQAHALSEIPTENRLHTWTATLNSQRKLSARLILSIHQEELGATKNPDIECDPAPMIGRIDVLLAQSTPLPDSAQMFLSQIRKMNFCSSLEFKMLRSLQAGLKSAQLLETTQK